MPISDLSELITAGNEDLRVEFKAWMDTSQSEVKANLARHIAALANHGGGYLIFGIDDKTRQPQGSTDLSPSLFNQDAISAIVKRYLDPRLQVVVERVQYSGVAYPVVIVPSHEARPVIAVADGPQDAKGRVGGIRKGTIYIRAAGPESVAISEPDDWNTLLERCLSHRSDLLGKILRQSIAKQTQPSARNIELLLAAVNNTADDFAVQIAALAERVPSKERERVRAAGGQFSALGYALLDGEGELMEIEDLRGMSDRVAVAMHRYAYYGWASFLPLTYPERAPQVRTGTLLAKDLGYLEGMRLENTGLLTSAFDYWRIYECGIAVTVESFREDRSGSSGDKVRHLTALQILIRIHSLLAHARLLGQEIPGVHQVVVRMDWRGLSGRQLAWDEMRVVSPIKVADDRFVKTVALSWSDLRDTYFSALRRIALPFFNLFRNAGWLEPDKWLTRELVEQEFGKMQGAALHLFED
ncbi:hypothetical protein CU048_12140 [Beijerinckiaceae bacterium]|nr:hypothetical protein CU048_12140 [Beijerinckiaceae bacterium]